MDIKEITNDGLKRKYEVSVLKVVIEQKADDRMEEARGTFSMPGFRKGHVPFDAMKKMYGDRFIAEIKRDYVSEIIDELQTKNNFKIAGNPKVDLKDEEKNSVYTLEFEIFPTIESVDLSKISVEVKNPIISDQEVEQEMKTVFDHYNVKWNSVQRPAQNGDKVRISYVAKFNKKIVDKRENEIRLGDMQGFDENLIGKSLGDKVSFDYQYKKDGKEGRLMHYDVEIKEIFEEGKYEAVNEEFAKGVGFDSLEDFKKVVRDRLQHDADLLFVQKKSDLVVDKLIENSHFDVPEIFKEMEFRYVSYDFSKGNIVLPKDVDIKNEKGEIDKEKLTNALKEIADKRIRIRLLINKIGEDLGVEISDKEVLKRAKEMRIDESKLSSEMESNIRLQIFEERVCEKIEEKIQIVQEDVDVATFKKWLGIYKDPENNETQNIANENKSEDQKN